MRLDEYLVSEGLIASRSRAKRYIHRGLVKLNGEVVTKPSKQVKPGAIIEIAEEDRPEGYFKLKGIQNQSGILRPGDRVLDIGSSAGGFLMYASGIADEIVGIEYSEEFREPLEAVMEEYPNVKVLFGDAFNMDLTPLGEFDVILNDMTVEPAMSIEIMARFLPLLRGGGRVLQVLKLDKISDVEPFLILLEKKGLEIVKVIRPEKREAYVIARPKR
ncbi:S4 domain-containing protein [Methanocella arvoryzae]|uniref:Ribosomal RNA methyltransferase n=1 Tax=Methanocella arvoryzae (strain DSM 22066 / NBRC 105507 / MRE50) TaxID=351160 RepID=Q0W7S2_METAR|nr:S4 domain-containing protein [Methanocella arvoryzae]CAJ35571.1 putative ribosomal RNA methyltransferase [Methanocella arvoryzae MRE50]